MEWLSQSRHTVGERRRILVLILIMATASLFVAVTANYMLYRTALEEQRLRLVETAQSRARLMEAMARHDAIYEQNTPGGPEAATLSQIIDAHKNFEGFGETGEFTLARLEGDSIVFLLSQRHAALAYPQPVPFDSDLAEPMRRALSGLSGSLTGLDYRGARVLAAYEPVAELDLGIVAKIDMSEVNAPFLRSALSTLGVSVLVVLLGTFLFLRISNPMLRHLQEYSEHLKEMVEERTRELRESQEKLLAAERMATLGQLSGNISHELRNPLGVIGSSAYYLKEKLKDADKKVQQHLDRIQSGVGSATATIESLLDLTQMKKPHLVGFDLVAIIRDAIAISKTPSAIEITRDFPRKEVLVGADREQLRMAFKNIVKNASEAMGGKGTLTVAVHKTEDGQAEVSFTDTGPGIAPENLSMVFQPLFTTRAKGIGFGLSIAKMIIEKHGGIIEAKTESGKGATIVIRLPLYAGANKEE